MQTNPPVVICRINRETKQWERIAYLENAYDVNYTLSTTGLSTMIFKLPISDPKSEYLQPFACVELWDHNEVIGHFRIKHRRICKDAGNEYIEIDAEHLIASLRDKVMFHVNEISGCSTRDVIHFILSHPDEEDPEQQPKQSDWIVGNCDFDLTIDYLFENQTLLSALRSVTDGWTTEYLWKFDTNTYPFRVHLLSPSNEIKSEIRTGKNLLSFERDENFLDISNKVYALGSGEGINQVNLMNAENLEDPDRPINGHYYVEDADSIAQYGTIESIITDSGVEDKRLLLLQANQELASGKDSQKQYNVQAADLYDQFGTDKFVPGEMTRIVEEQSGEIVTGRILEVRKRNMSKNPGIVDLTVNFAYRGWVLGVNDTKKRVTKQETKAQGATNVWSRGFADNCDKEHPIEIKFRLPDDLVYVNKCMVDIDVSQYRAYEKGAYGGGGKTQLSAPATVTPSGGATTTPAGEGSTSVTAAMSVTYNGGAESITSEVLTNPEDALTGDAKWAFGTGSGVGDPYESLTARKFYPVEDVMAPHGEGYSDVPNHWHWIRIHYNEHSHKVELPDHTHNIPGHQHTIPPHQHTVPPHQHDIPGHSHTMENHEHDLVYGIFEAGNPLVNGLKIYIDGNLVGTAITPIKNNEVADLDIIPYLAKNEDGTVARGKHTLRIEPSPSDTGAGLCRISGELYIQCFVRSRGSYTVY